MVPMNGRLTAALVLAGAMLVVACAPAASPSTPTSAKASANAPAPTAPAQSVAQATTAAEPKPSSLTARPTPLNPTVMLNMGLLRVASDLGFLLALDRGYFQEEGLEINLVDFQFLGQMVAPMATGELDLGTGGISAALFGAGARGIPIKIVANELLVTPEDKSCVFMARSEIIDSGTLKDSTDLKGLVFGLGAVGSSNDTLLDTLLKEAGLQRSDIEIKQVPFPDQIAALANKSLDVVQSFEPFRTRMLDEGVGKVWRTCGEIVSNYELAVLVYGPSMENKREAGNRFMVAYLRGVREFRELGVERRDPQIIELATKYTSIKDPQLWRRMELPRGNPDGYNYPESLGGDLAWLAANGFLDRAPSLSEVTDRSYVDYAIARLGRYRPGCSSNPCP